LGQNYYFITDALGSTIKVVDTSGDTVNEYVYDSFGNMVSKTEGVTNYYTYTGREWDAESDLYYYRMRYYDPAMGRFLNQDPMGFSQGPNFYTYTRNNPTIYTDSFGLWFEPYHFMLSAYAGMGALFNFNDISVIAEASARADEKYNDIGNSEHWKWHYYDDDEVARDAAITIKEQFNLALNEPDRITRLTFLGEGLHVLQDRWAHKAFGIKPPNEMYPDVVPTHFVDLLGPATPHFYVAEYTSWVYLTYFQLASRLPVWKSALKHSVGILAGF
jgi:RHS repeat-associated protein